MLNCKISSPKALWRLLIIPLISFPQQRASNRRGIYSGRPQASPISVDHLLVKVCPFIFGFYTVPDTREHFRRHSFPESPTREPKFNISPHLLCSFMNFELFRLLLILTEVGMMRRPCSVLKVSTVLPPQLTTATTLSIIITLHLVTRN